MCDKPCAARTDAESVLEETKRLIERSRKLFETLGSDPARMRDIDAQLEELERMRKRHLARKARGRERYRRG